MNSKDLLSINEAFANATSKVTTDQPAKKDEVVTEGTENVNEILGPVLKHGANIASMPFRGIGAVGRGIKKAGKWAGDKADQRKDDRKAGRALRKHREKGKKREDEATEDVVDEGLPPAEFQPQQPVRIVDPAAPDAPGETGEVIQVNPDGTVTVGTEANPDGVVVPIDQVEPLDDAGDPGQGSGEVSTLDDVYDSVMADYENNLSKNFGVKTVKEKAAGKDFKKPDEKVSEVDSKTQRPKGEVNPEEKSKDIGGAKEDLQEPVEGTPKEEEKKPKKKKKLAKESINNCNKGNIMSEDKSIFDKLYESVMGEDDEFELGIPGDDDPTAGDEFGDEGGAEVTVTLTSDQAAALKAVVDQLPSDDEEELGDVGDEDPLADTSELEDAVQEDTTHDEGRERGLEHSRVVEDPARVIPARSQLPDPPEVPEGAYN